MSSTVSYMIILMLESQHIKVAYQSFHPTTSLYKYRK